MAVFLPDELYQTICSYLDCRYTIQTMDNVLTDYDIQALDYIDRPVFLPDELYQIICSYVTDRDTILNMDSILTDYDIQALDYMEKSFNWLRDRCIASEGDLAYHHLLMVVRLGNLDILKWLYDLVGTPDDVDDIIGFACSCAHLETLEWIYEDLGIDIADNIHVFDMVLSDKDMVLFRWLHKLCGVNILIVTIMYKILQREQMEEGMEWIKNNLRIPTQSELDLVSI